MKNVIFLILCLLPVGSLQAQPANDADLTSQSFISIQVATINSMGEFKESFDKGSAFYAGYGVLYSNQWAFILETGYITFQANEEMEFSGDPTFTMIPLAIGGRYYFVTDRFRPFLLAMSGLNIVTQKYELHEENVDNTELKLHFQVGIGLGILLFSQLEIEGQAKYNCHILEANLPYNATGMEFGIALNWHL